MRTELILAAQALAIALCVSHGLNVWYMITVYWLIVAYNWMRKAMKNG